MAENLPDTLVVNCEPDFLGRVTRYLDGHLSDEELAQLNRDLAEKPANREAFVRICLIESLLADELSQEQALPDLRDFEPCSDSSLHNAVIVPALKDEPERRPHDAMLPTWQEPRRRTSIWRHPAVRAAAVLLFVGIAALVMALSMRRSAARLVAAEGCRWKGTAPRLGQPLARGEMILRDGVAEIAFDSSASVIVQGPARFKIESGGLLRLLAGKATAQVPDKAHGFTIATPSASVVDLGTEFGVAVDDHGNSEVEVFAGQVEVGAGKGAPKAAPLRLHKSQAVRVDVGQPAVVVAALDQAFVRSMDEVRSLPLIATAPDDTVLAWWRFENGTAGRSLPRTGATPAAFDMSGNGNHLYGPGPAWVPSASDHVPAAMVAGQPNRLSMDNSDRAGGTHRCLQTESQKSAPVGVDIQAAVLTQWTVEASVKLARFDTGGRYLTFVGRDGWNQYTNGPKLTPFAFRVNDHHFDVRFGDVADRSHVAEATGLTIELNKWYHVAAVCDGRVLRLYVDSLDGQGYQLRASTELPADGKTGMLCSDRSYAWSLGRGSFQEKPSDWFPGWIDEVRICSKAVSPAQFLFAGQR